MSGVRAAIGGFGQTAGQTMGRVATATTMAAGAAGSAAVNGVVGGVAGAAAGVKRGLGSGSKSTPAAALTIGALGVAGLVEWPVLLAVGGGALLLHKTHRTHRMNQKHEVATPPVKAKLTTLPAIPASTTEKAKPENAITTRKAAAKKATGRRRTGTTGLRSTN